jgi:hypothetical protein
MTRNELTFYIHDGIESFRLEIKGHLCAENAANVAQAVRTAESTIADRLVIIQVDGLSGIDDVGRALLRAWHDAGARIIAKSPSARMLAGSIAREPIPPKAAVSKRTRLWCWGIRSIPLVMLFCPEQGIAANLTPQTSAAWEQYIESATARMERRVSPGQTFLWVDEAPERLTRVRAGEVVVSPAVPQNPKRVAGGLIHDWVGAVFVPGVELADVLDVVSDFAAYKNYYRPTVVDSKVITNTDTGGRFSMLLLNQSLLLKTAFDTDYESRYVRVGQRHAYSISHTTRVQEIADYGAPAQHLLQEGQGTGFIWRLFSIARFLQRDGGVYIELEAIGLSRDIPASLRWLVDPIVGRVARGSLATALQQTGKAVCSHVEAAIPVEDRRRLSVAFSKE